MFDLVNTVELTAAAAVVVAVLSLAFGATPRTRIAITSGLVTWFVLVLVAGATGILNPIGGLGVGALPVAVVTPIVVLTTLALGTEAGRARVAAVPISVLVGLQTIRVAGITFVMLYAAHRLPAPFAPLAGWGDIAVGVLSPVVALMAARAPASSRGPIVAVTALGMLDLVTAVTLGALSAPGPIQIFAGTPDARIMTSLPWIFIPCFLVPAFFAVHLVTLAKLRGEAAARAATPLLA